jgi:uncharacterized ferritin-like protein (DUF455 family)
MANVFEQVAAALACSDPNKKLALTAALATAWQAGVLDANARTLTVEVGRPARPELVPPAQLPSRGAHTREGRAALIHAIAHIEFNAINLALDHIVRFPSFPAEYISDWIQVAAEEAYHFGLVRDHLRTLGYEYGDFVAHDGLWQMTVKTAHDPLARMALVPRLLEARGLDATPPIQQKLKAAGDAEAVAILDIILRDEVGHVAIGDRWFRVLCEQQGLEPEATYRTLLSEYSAPWPQPPLNEKARRAAGFSETELRALVRQRKPSNAD